MALDKAVVAERFMQFARNMLDAETFRKIQDAAVKSLDRQVDRVVTKRENEIERLSLTYTDAEPVKNDKLKERVAAITNDEEPPEIERPHAVERIEERLEIEISNKDLGLLTAMVRNGDHNVRLTKTQMQAVEHCEVQFLGKTFVVIYNRSNDRIVTAYPKRKKRAKVYAGRPRSRAEEIRHGVDEYYEGE